MKPRALTCSECGHRFPAGSGSCPVCAAPAGGETCTVAELQARALQRQDAQLADRRLFVRARAILAVAGWEAPQRQLEAAAELDQDIKEEERQAVVVKALQLQQDPQIRARHVRPGEATMPKGTQIPRADEIRAFMDQRRKADPELTARQLHTEVTRKFKVTVSLATIYSWFGALKKTNGKPAAAPKTPASPAPAPAPPGRVPQHACSEAAAGPSIHQDGSGRVLVRFEFWAEPHEAALLAQLIARGLSSMQPAATTR